MTESSLAGAYELLSRPIEEISDADLEIIIADLRRRRELYKAGKGTNDRPDKPKPGPVSAEDKKAATASILAGLDLKV